MRIAVSISLLSIVVLLSACIKDTSGSQPMLVQTITIDSNACSINFTYDGQNRLTSSVQCDTSETFTYSHDSVIDIKMMINEQVIIYENIYTLNAKGLATGCVRIGGGGEISSSVFVYDVNGFMLSSTDTTHPNTANTYVIQNKDMLTEQSTSSVTGQSYSITTTYYANTINRIGNANFGLTFIGASSVNLKKADTYSGLNTINYTYQLDNNNGIARQVSTVDGVVTDARSFSYY